MHLNFAVKVCMVEVKRVDGRRKNTAFIHTKESVAITKNANTKEFIKKIYNLCFKV